MHSYKDILNKLKILDFARDIRIKYNRISKMPFYDFEYNNYQIRNELVKELNNALNLSNEYEMLLYINKFEQEFAKYCSVKYSTGTSSGTAALQFSLLALNIGEGDEVITVPNSYIATALSISNTGAKPVFVDIDPITYNIDVNKIEEKITDKTKAIVPVHLYGQSTNLDPVNKIAERHNLKIIEDACQACGGEYKNKKVGSYCDVGCFSFHSSKILGGPGSGGIAVSNNPEIIENIRQLQNPESNDEDLSKIKRTPAYLDPLQTTFLKARLLFLEMHIKQKRKNAKLYNELLRNVDIVLPKEENYATHSYYSYVIQTENRDKLKKYLDTRGIETRIEYKTPLHLTKTYQYLGNISGDFPITEKTCKRILSLPIGIHLSTKDIGYISRNIKNFIRKNG